MKKYLSLGIIACAIFFSINVFAQTNTFPTSGNAGIGTTSPQYPLDIRHSGYFAGHFQTTASSGQTSLYFENDRGSFASYGGFLYGGSSCSLGNLFGQTRSDKLFMFADGTSSQGFWAGTLNATPFAIGTNDTERMRILANGNVGIGTANPQALLDLGGGNGVKMLFYGSGGNSGYYCGTGINLGQSSNEASIFIGGDSGTCCGAANFAIVSADQSTWPYSSYTTRLVVNAQSGNVGIGTTTPQAKLAVNGDMYARKVKVTQIGWPDYVFHTSYRLRPLSEVERYIKLYHHLPEVPSAAAIEKDDLDLGDNQAMLLKKIEELTLYIIGMNKEMEGLKKEIKQIKAAQN